MKVCISAAAVQEDSIGWLTSFVCWMCSPSMLVTFSKCYPINHHKGTRQQTVILAHAMDGVFVPHAICHHSSRTLLHLEKVRILLELVMNTCLINATCILHGDGGHAVTALA
jgi:hypothetical protein